MGCFDRDGDRDLYLTNDGPNLIGMLAEVYLAIGKISAGTSLSPVEQQVVLLTTSFSNRCA